MVRNGNLRDSREVLLVFLVFVAAKGGVVKLLFLDVENLVLVFCVVLQKQHTFVTYLSPK